MRGKRAKEIKKRVMVEMYVDATVSLEELKKEKKNIFKNSDFVPVYRAAKKNYTRPKPQRVKHMEQDTGYDEKMAVMCGHRLRKNFFPKIKLRNKKVSKLKNKVKVLEQQNDNLKNPISE